jgi:2-succinyl-5-enolpyruvyl-6-hydroxy-3-cyclohexene-1-carboxylate synthase
MKDEVWYRAEDKRYADYDPWAEYEQPTSSHAAIVMHEYDVLSVTPRGVVVRGDTGERRFIHGCSIKQLAVPTKELALADLIARKRRQIFIYEARIRNAKQAIALAQKKDDKPYG